MKAKNLNHLELYWATFNRFELLIPGGAVVDCGASGAVDNAVAYWKGEIQRPDKCTPEKLRDELREYGAWDVKELADDDANWGRIIWIAANNISDERHLR
jgi:hypothetical protein